MSPAPTPRYAWEAIRWRDAERRVFKLQKRIDQAQCRGETKAVHRLQRLLVTSWSAKCLAVRRVTQDNRGKRTAGVDGVTALTPPPRFRLARTLRLAPKARPTRRVWIPQPGTADRRPLGIPTLHDRAAQALLKLAREPEWEAKFEPNSDGFRPGRSGHDAIEAILIGVCPKPKFVLDADIAKCFDRINHDALLRKLATTPTFRRVVRAWLKAGVMDGRELFPTDEGTPQGGVISPLLANVARHGLETAVVSAVPRWNPANGKEGWAPIVGRYADDFVVLPQDLAVIERITQHVAEWLRDLGLELKPSKTRVVHTLRTHDGARPGCACLGFRVQPFPVGKTHSGKRTRRPGGPVKRLGFKTIITPSKDARRRHDAARKEIVRRHQNASQADLIRRLNAVIRGWTAHYATVASHRVFVKLDRQVYLKLRRWATRRHRNKPAGWVVRTYWRLERGRWDFATTDGIGLLRPARTPIRRHVKVRGTKSPDDGDGSYWATRLGRPPGLPRRVATLLKKQRGRCAWGRRHVLVGDGWEIDHIVPTSHGGPDDGANQQLLHRHCHDQKSAGDGSRVGVPMTTGQTVEEPDEGKPARPVLQTSRSGD